MNSIVYLGAELTSSGKCASEIKRRITVGAKCAGALNKVLSDKNISRKAKIHIYKTIIRPTVIYGSESWTVTEESKHRLETWERKILRKIYRGVKENGIWRRRTNNELKDIFKEIDIITAITQNRLRWLGHIIRMSENDLTKIIYNTEIAGKNRKGRPRKTWWQNVEEDIEFHNLHDWKNEATNRRLWKSRIQAIGLQA